MAFESLTLNLVIAVSAVAIGGGFQHGYHTGVLNNPVDVIEGFFKKSLSARHLNDSDGRVKLFYSLSVVVYMFGGMVGGSMIGTVSSHWGRKRGLYYITFLMLIAAPLMTVPSFSHFFEFFLVGRFLVGIMCGANCGLATMYLSEVSPLNLRGSMSTLYQVNISLSILVSQTIGIRQLLGNERNWIYLSLVPIGLVLLSGFMLNYCPESPKYLLSKGGEGNVVEAKKALIWLRNRPETHVRPELLTMIQQEDLQRQEAQIRVIDLFTTEVLRQPMMISLMLMAGQQFSGVNIWVFFSHKVMEHQMGNREDVASIMTCVLSLVSLVMTVASFVIVDLAGRKTLLITSFVGLAISCLSLTLLQSMSEMLTPIVQNFLLNGSAIAFNAFYAIGAGPIPWFLVSELFEQSARSSATTLAVMFNWFCSAMVGFIFPIMSDKLSHFVYMVFFIVNMVSAVYVYNQVPETSNKTVEEIVTKFNDDPRNYILRSAPYRESTATQQRASTVTQQRQSTASER